MGENKLIVFLSVTLMVIISFLFILRRPSVDSAVNAQFYVQDNETLVGEEETVTIALGEKEPFPTAFTIQVLFDPEKILIKNVSVEGLWTDANVLEELVDNEEGEIVFSAGQGFDAELIENRSLMTLTFVGIDEGEVKLRMGAESEVVRPGRNKALNLKATEVALTIN